MSEDNYQYNSEELASVTLFTTTKDEAALYADHIGRLGYDSEQVFIGNLDKATEWVKANVIPAAMFVDIDQEQYPLESLARLGEVCGPTCKIVALGSAVNLDLYRNMLAQGIFDYLLKPVTLDRLANTLNSMKKGQIEEQLIGRTIAVTGAKGGVGASTVAYGIAQLLANQQRVTTGMVDFDRTNGCLGLLAGLKEQSGLDGVLKSDSIDVRFLNRSMTSLSDKLSLLSHTPDYQTAMQLLSEEQVLSLGGTLCQMFNQVVWDIPAGQPQGGIDVLACAHTRVLVAEYTIAAARNTLRLIQEIGDESEGQRIVIVANARHESSQVIARNEFEKFIGRSVDIELPSAGKTIEQMLLKGPLNIKNTGLFGDTLADLVDIICGRPTTKKGKRALLSKLTSAFERKAS